MRTGVKALAMLAGATLALSACASGDNDQDTGDAQESTAPVTITWGYEQEFQGFNPNTIEGNSAANAVVLNQVLRGFWYFAPDGTVTPDKDYGTYEKTSDTPLTVKYTFNEKAVWSDGEPLDCDDAVLAWLANANVTGEKGFSAASTAGYEEMNKPACKDGEKTFTTTYKTPFADWASQFGPSSAQILPAHIVEKQGGVADIIAAADNPTAPELAKAIEFYNTGWALNPGTVKAEIMPSAGPYKITKWQAGQSLTLEQNDKWWGTPPKSKTIVLRYLAGDQQAAALQNGEIDLADPQPQVELVNQLKALGDRVKFSTADQYTYEHITFNFKGLFADRNLREAFAKCIPRQQIVDNLIKPQNADAKVLQSRYTFPFQDEYSQVENGVGGEKYNQVDIAGAKQLVDAAGKSGTTVRLGWRKDPEQINKRRVDTLALIQASCKQAGFNVVDAGAPDFFENAWANGNFDVAMFAWTGSPLVTGSSSTYQTNGGNNNGKYSNPATDQLISQLNQEIDKSKQFPLTKQIDTQLWTDLMNVPLFAFPGVLATVPEAEGVEFNATQSDLSWNAHQWTLKQQ